MTKLDSIEQLLRLAPDAMLVADSERRLVATNGAARSILGLEAHGSAGVAMSDLLPSVADLIHRSDAGPSQAAPSGTQFDGAALVRAANGSSVTAAVRWHWVTFEGRRLIVLTLHPTSTHNEADSGRAQPSMAQHIHDRADRLQDHARHLAERTMELEHRSHELQRRTSELEEVNRQLESFSYSVSHDLRAPLRAISGFAEILAKRHRDQLDTRGQHFLDNIVEASTHMGRLIDDLLTYSRLSQADLTFGAVGLADVMYHVQRHLTPRLEQQGAELLLPDALPIVHGGHTLLMQIFTNLFENALTYRKPHVPPRIAVNCEEAQGFVTVSVADNGIGIDAEHFDRIFEVFQRLHNQEAYPGTGVGLAVVKKAVGLQSGTVWLDSVVGIGTTFHVRLPGVSGSMAKAAGHRASYSSGAARPVVEQTAAR